MRLLRQLRVPLSSGLLGTAIFLAASPCSAKPPACPRADGTVEDPTYPMRKQPFAAMEAKDPEEARRLFQCAADATPQDQIALAQLVYLDIDANQKPSAIRDIQALRRRHAQTKELEMQLGYLYAEQMQLIPARMAFERAIEYNDPATTAQARKALGVITAEWPDHSFGFYLDSEYMSRFSGEIVDSDARVYQRLGWQRLGWLSPVSVYVHSRTLRDTASHAGELPEIYSDNAAMFGGGLFLQPIGAHYFVSGEANEAYLFKENTTGRTALKPDYRAVAGYFRSWPARSGPVEFEANGSVGFYSRYQHDGIAYPQPREIVNMFRAGPVGVSGYLAENLAFDTNQEFYNNTAEIAPGLDLHTKRIRYTLFRDRKGLFSGYLNLVSYGMLLTLLGNRVAQRMICVARVAERDQIWMAPVRMVWATCVDLCSTVYATYRFLSACATGRPLKWDKTAHEYPTEELIRRQHRKLGEMLLEKRYISPAQLLSALEEQKEQRRRLGEVLMSMLAITEDQLHRTLVEQYQPMES